MTTSPFDPSEPTSQQPPKQGSDAGTRTVFFGPPSAPPLGQPLGSPTDPGSSSAPGSSSDPGSSTAPGSSGAPGSSTEPSWFDRSVESAMAWFRRNSPAKEPSRWLAGVGALLLLVAGLSMTIAKWQSISSPMRLGGLVVIHLIVVVLAERLRPTLPDVARALVHLGSGLFAATGIQAVSTLGKAIGYEPMGGRWALCCFVGGIAASIALEVQRRRWAARWMQGEMVLAVGLAGVGLSALSHIPVGIVAACCAASAFSLRRNTESIALGATSLACPFIGALIIDWGPGTGRALGLVGETLGWAAPIAGGLAAATLWLAAQARQSSDPTLGQTLRTAATIGLALNLLVGYSHSDIDLSVSAWAWIVWLSLAAVGTYRKNAMICALTSFLAPAPLAIQLEALNAAPQTYALSFAGLSIVALATLVAARGSAFVSKIGYAGVCGAAVALGLVADSFNPPVDLRIVGMSLIIAGLATSLRGRFVDRKDIVSIGAGIGALGIVAELLSFPTDHAFDIWLPTAAIAAAAVEWTLRAKDRIIARYPFVTSAATLSFYAIVGQLVHAGNVRVMIAVFVGLLLLTVGTLRSLNSVAVAGVATLLGSLGLAVGPQLATMPLWGQCALGGFVLFALAAALERRRIAARTAQAQAKQPETGVSPR